jgi:hypothetical protein
MMQRPRGIGSLTPSYDYQSLSQMGDPLVMARARREYAPQRYSQFDYLLDPVASRDVAPAPAPMPTQPTPSDPVATQFPPATPPMQTDPTPRPDPMPVTPEAFDPTVPVSDPMQPERPDPIIDTKPTPTTLAELEAMLGYKWIKNEDTSPIRNMMYTDQDRLRDFARQYGIALPPDAPIDMTGFEDPPLDSTQPDGTTPPVETTPPVNMPALGTVINLPFGGSFTIPNDIQERIDAAKAAAETATTTTPRANIATTTSPMVGGRRGLMSREAIENLRRRVQEMRTPSPTDTRMPTRLPPTLPINVGQQRAPQLPMPRRLPTPVPNLPDFLQRSQPIDERLEEAKRVIAEMQRGPTPKLPRRRIPINTDKLRRGRG